MLAACHPANSTTGVLKKNQITKFGLRALISIKLVLHSCQGENLIHYVLLVFSVCCLQLDIQLTAPRGFLKKNQSTKFGFAALISIKLAQNSCKGENWINFVRLVLSVWCLQLDIQLIQGDTPPSWLIELLRFWI